MNENIRRKLDRARDICKPVAAKIEYGLNGAKGKFSEVSAKFRKRYMDLKRGNRQTLDSLGNYFNERVEVFKNSYDSDKLFKKIGDVAKVAGSNVVYMVLVLYYSLLGKDVSLKDRAMVLAALGYFISPFDFIPDILGVMGFSDDFAVLMLVFRKIRDNVTSEVHLKAKARLAEWFGNDSLDNIKI